MAVTRNQSRQNSPTRKDGRELASSSEGSIKDMLSSLMESMNEIRGEMNTMQVGFATLHADVALVRDQVGHEHSIPSNDREEARSMGDRRNRRDNDGGDDGVYSKGSYSGASRLGINERSYGYRSNVGSRGGRGPESRDRNHYSCEVYKEYGGYARWRHDEYAYGPRYHDNGLGKGRSRERVPKPHEEPHSRRVKDHDRHKGYEWSMEEEVSSNARKSSNSRHGGDISRRGIPPKKVDLSHPIRHTKVPLWLSSNFPPSKSLIQSSKRSSLYFKCDDVDHVVKERVNHKVDFVDDGDEEQCEDDTHPTFNDEDTHPTFNDNVSSIMEVEDECKPIKALQVLSIEPKPHEVAKANEYLRKE